MELIDTHCHLTFDELAPDIEQVLQRSRKAGVKRWITVGTGPQDCKKAVELAAGFEGLYAAVGIHPHYAGNISSGDIVDLKDIARQDKVVAIGETGLDLYYDFSKRQDQELLFTRQLEIACQLNLPVIVHSRGAFDQTLEILDLHSSKIPKVVFHCFGGSAEQAKLVLDRGFYISFTGVVTFKNAALVREAAQLVPTERLMLETDCPYMSPEPVRKERVNEPALMVHTAKFLAGLKGIAFADFAKDITETSRGFFAIG